MPKPTRTEEFGFLVVGMVIGLLIIMAILALFDPKSLRADDWYLEWHAEHPEHAEHTVQPPVQTAPTTVPELVVTASEYYGLNAGQMLSIARCESRFNPLAVNPSSGASGVFQFLWTTWTWASGRAGFAGASPLNPVANVWTAAWLARTEGTHHWRQCGG